MSAALNQDAATAFLISDDSSIQIPLASQTLIGRDFGFTAKGVSRKHCVVRLHKERYYVADMNSTHGTFVNKQRLVSNQWTPLGADDVLTVGSLSLKIQTGRAPSREVETTEQTDGTEGSSDAEFGARLIAYGIDNVSASIIARLVLIPVSGVSMAAATALEALAFALIFFVPLILTGQTLGMKLLKLKLVDRDGRSLTWQRVLVRDLGVRLGGLCVAAGLVTLMTSFLRLPSVSDLIGALGVLALLGFKIKMDGETFWDRVCRTRVIRVD